MGYLYYMEICTLLDKSFLINLNVTGYMEISMELFGTEFLN